MQVESTPQCLCITRITGPPMPNKESPRLSMVWSLSTERDWSASEIQQLEELTPSALDRTEECQLPPGLKFKEPNITPSAGKSSPLVTSRVSSTLEFPWVALQSVMWWQLQKRCPTASMLWKVSLVTLKHSSATSRTSAREAESTTGSTSCSMTQFTSLVILPYAMSKFSC